MAQERTFAVMGLGTFGYEVCRVLASRGGRVIAVDNNPTLIERIKEEVTQAVYMDSTSEESLMSLPLDTIDVAVVAIAEDLNANIMTTALLKKLGIPYIISRALTEMHAQILRQIGAHEVVNIEQAEGRRIAQRIVSPDVLDRIPISDEQALAEVVVPKSFVGKPLSGLDLRKKFSINVVSIKRTHMDVDELGNPVKRAKVISPEPTTVMEDNDVIVVIGSDKSIDEFKGY